MSTLKAFSREIAAGFVDFPAPEKSAVRELAPEPISNSYKLFLESLINYQNLTKCVQKKFNEILQNFEFGSVRRCADVVALENCCKMSICLRKSASIQPRTDRPQFGDEKCGFGS